MVVSQRRSGGAAALVAAAVFLLLGLSDHIVEAKKVKRVKAGTTYKTHDRKLTDIKILGTVDPPRTSKQGTNKRKRRHVMCMVVAGKILAMRKGS